MGDNSAACLRLSRPADTALPARPSVAIVGAGAIGCYYGARLALAGVDVRFLLRSGLERILEQGITLRERDGERRLKEVAAFADPADIGPVDLVVVTLKTTANAALARLLPPLVGPATAVLTLQNGLGTEEEHAALVGAERMLGGVCFIGVVRESPGELVGFHTPGAIELGEFERPAGTRARDVAALFSRAGVRTQAVDNLTEARWRKLIWNIPFNGLAIAAGGLTTDRILADPALTAEVRGLMDEVAAAGRRLGCEISDAFVQRQIDVTRPMGPYRPSSLVDFLAGREVEIEAIWGEPLRRAQAVGLPMPRLATLHERLRSLARS